MDLGPVVEPFPEVLALYLFGSRSRGTARADSDLDLALLLRPGLAETVAFELRLQLGALLSEAAGLAVDLVRLGDDLDLTFRILREGQRLFERDRDRVRYEEARLASLYYDYQPFLEAYLSATRDHFRRG